MEAFENGVENEVQKDANATRKTKNSNNSRLTDYKKIENIEKRCEIVLRILKNK